MKDCERSDASECKKLPFRRGARRTVWGTSFGKFPKPRKNFKTILRGILL